MFKLPPTRRQFWAGKIVGNSSRDERTLQTLVAKGWRVLPYGNAVCVVLPDERSIALRMLIGIF